MYEAFFKFRNRPFVPTPQIGTYYPASIIETARQTLARVIERCEGPGLITGPPGTGKTLLCQLLAEQFRDQLAVVMLSSGRLKTCQAMLQAILYELDLPYQGLQEGELRLALVDYLEPKSDGVAGLLLLIDEAHTLPWRLLDEARLITNLVRNGQPRVRLVLAGGPVLEERFASPKMGSFSQRVAARCYLERLNSAETAEYVRAQISAAGGDPGSLVDDDMLRSVYRASDGIPRLINQVCDHALILAFLGGHGRLTSEAIDEAWADLQQLPTPCSVAAADVPSGAVVEFGQLEGEQDDQPEAIPFRGLRAQPPQPQHAGEPEEQLEAIAHQLSEIESGAPESAVIEVDLDFPEYSDPFGERFAEEEVVVDRYSSDVEIFADVPRVSSWEGQQLGSMLDGIEEAEAWDSETYRPNIRLTEVTEEGAAPAAADDSDADSFVAASDPVMPEDEPQTEPAVELPPETTAEPPAVQEAAGGGVQPRSLEALTGVSSDRDLIVVEDDQPRADLPSAARPTARKAEFRQLFAKLRRG